MAITRITQNMLTQRSLDSLQAGLGRLAKTQEQLSTGKTINRPSDDPAGAGSAMRLRDTLASTQQHQRNADDGLAWLGLTDSTITSLGDQARAARDVGLQAANDGAMDQTARNALADTIDGLREGMIGTANTTYLGRPVFGGVTGGSVAYDASGTYVGTPGTVDRVVGDGVTVRVDTDGRSVLGPTGDSVLDHLSALSTALRRGTPTGSARSPARWPRTSTASPPPTPRWAPATSASRTPRPRPWTTSPASRPRSRPSRTPTSRRPS